LRLGYFDQKLSSLCEDRTAIEEIQSMRSDLSPEVVRQYLAKFRFFGDDPFRTVALLGGERSRPGAGQDAALPAQRTALDEPTNHLDIPARETLEHALDGYEGLSSWSATIATSWIGYASACWCSRTAR